MAWRLLTLVAAAAAHVAAAAEAPADAAAAPPMVSLPTLWSGIADLSPPCQKGGCVALCVDVCVEWNGVGVALVLGGGGSGRPARCHSGCEGSCV